MRLLLVALAAASFVAISDAALAAMSIDLGSQFIKLALVKTGVPMEIVLNKESRRKTPNLLGFKGSERFFSDAAANLALKTPKTTYPFLLELIGKKDGDPAVARFHENFPFNEFSTTNRSTIKFDSGEATYDVETLLAMILWSAKKTTEAYAEQSVKDVVITVPTFFNQAERRAVAVAADIAGLNLLQILNCASAAALNYGVFRRKEITEKSTTMLIYDMGASKTEATIVEYQLAEDKDSKTKNPVVRTLGYGFDRSLGGLEMTLRLKKHLEGMFRKEKKTPTDIAKNPRSMAKLQKEAERVKQVLSANTNTFAQIENVHEDMDFRTEVTREQFEGLIGDLDERIKKPVEDALKMAELDIKSIDQIVLMGAGTRVPRVKAVLSSAVGGLELGNFLNTDEAIALGAVYQSARLSKSFKVLPFNVQEPVLYPIKIDFESTNEAGERKPSSKTLFNHKTYYPANKKIVTLTSYSDDFHFSLNYGELPLNADQLKEFGSRDLLKLSVNEVKAKLSEATSVEGSSFKGFKVHVKIDDSGIISVEKVELNAEQPPPEPTPEELAAAAKAAEQKEAEDSFKQAEEAARKQEEEAEKKEGEKGEEKTEEKTEEKKDETEKKDEKKEEEKEKKKEEPKPKKIRVKMPVVSEELDVVMLNEYEIKTAKEILAKFEADEKAKHDREEAQNQLEAALYDLADKLETKEGIVEYMKDDERTQLGEKVGMLKTWMEDEAGFDTKTEEFKDRKQILDDTIKSALTRRTEYLAFPKLKEDLESLFNSTDMFLVLSANMTKKTETDEEGIYTETEITTLTKKFVEVKEWFKGKLDEREKLVKNDDPTVTRNDIEDKGADLQREVKYLYNKMTSYKPKVKKDEKAKNETETETTEEGAKDGEDKKSEEKVEEKKEDTKKEEETTHDASDL